MRGSLEVLYKSPSSMSVQVTTLIESLPLMMDVGILILWLVLVFSIIGMQQWLGKMSFRCFDAVSPRCHSTGLSRLLDAVRSFAHIRSVLFRRL